MSQLDLWSSAYFEQKAWERVQDAKGKEFLPYDAAREKYITEKIEPMLARYRESDHEWFSDFSRRRGEMMHSSDLIYRLQQLNPHIFVQSQINFLDDWGLYSSAFGRVQFLTGMPRGWMTELSYAITDDRDLPVEERRGWRTVLVYLLLKGAIGWEEMLREFGEPNDAWNEQRWCETLLDFRHGGEQQVHRNIANLIEYC